MRNSRFAKNILHAPVIIWGLNIITVLKSRIILDIRKSESAFVPVHSPRKNFFPR